MNLYKRSSMMPGIPYAQITRAVVTGADIWFEMKKKELAHRIPILDKNDISRYLNPYHLTVLKDMEKEGHAGAVNEIVYLLIKEEEERQKGKNYHYIVQLKEKFMDLVDNLKIICHLKERRMFDQELSMRLDYCEKILKTGDYWLAKHFLQTCLELGEVVRESEERKRILAQVHCFLAYIAREENESLESALSVAIEHLNQCREFCHHQPWIFHPNVLSIRLLTPVAIHGLRDETIIVDGCSLPMYLVATLLEHELLISLANQVIQVHNSPTQEDLIKAHFFADDALRLALEVRESCAISSALLKFGIILRHSGAYDDALNYFHELLLHSELTGDRITEAVTYHNIALCKLGNMDSLAALECLIKQKTIAEEIGEVDLNADAMRQIGYILLEEGQLWEAEEMASAAYKIFNELNEKELKQNTSRRDSAWAMAGIAAGHHIFSRFAGLIRTDNYNDLDSELNWTFRRQELPPVKRPFYNIEKVEDVFAAHYAKANEIEVVEKPIKTQYFHKQLLENEDEGESDSEDSEKSAHTLTKTKSRVSRGSISQLLTMRLAMENDAEIGREGAHMFQSDHRQFLAPDEVAGEWQSGTSRFHTASRAYQKSAEMREDALYF